MDPYHFINFPKDANTYDQQRDCKLRNCTIEAIAWYVQVLNSPVAPRMKSELHSGSLPISSAISISRYMPGSLRIAVAIALMFDSTAGRRIFTHYGILASLSGGGDAG
jgi:hypothetical protein